MAGGGLNSAGRLLNLTSFFCFPPRRTGCFFSDRKNEESQALEDTTCLVFLDYYFEEFALKHSDEKVIDILKKTWVKMTEKAHKEALKISYSEKSLALVKKAIS